jgi:hypothetical protein
MIKYQWVPFDGSFRESTTLQFDSNLKKVKKETMSWAHEKKYKDEKEIVLVEAKLEELYLQNNVG